MGECQKGRPGHPWTSPCLREGTSGPLAPTSPPSLVGGPGAEVRCLLTPSTPCPPLRHPLTLPSRFHLWEGPGCRPIPARPGEEGCPRAGGFQSTGCQAGSMSTRGGGANRRSEAGQGLLHTQVPPEGWGGGGPGPPSPQARPCRPGHSTSPSSMLKLLLRLLALEASGDMVEKRGSEASGSRESSRSMRSRSFLDRSGNGEACSGPRGSG